MPTTSFSMLDRTKVLYGGRWTRNATQVTSQSVNGDIRFSFTGTDLQVNYAASGTAAFDISIDGGTFTAVTTLNTVSKTLLTVATGLSDTTHTAAIRLNTGYSNGGLKFWSDDGIVVTGAAPAVSAFTNADTTGLQHLLWTDSRLQHNYTGEITDAASPAFPSVGSNALMNARCRFKTDGAVLWVWARCGTGSSYRCFIDGFAEEEYTDFTLSGSFTPTYGWMTFTLPNDGSMHEIMLTGRRGFDSVMVSGGTGIFASDYASGCSATKVAFVGDSVTSADSATGYSNGTMGLEVLTEVALPGRFTLYNRGISGQSVTTWTSNGRVTTELLPISPDIVISWMGVNDMAGLTNDTLRDQKRDEYKIMYREILRLCPKAKLYQIPPGAHETTNRTRLLTALSDACTAIAAEFPSRTCQFITMDASWLCDPASATAGYVRAGSHPYPAGYTVLAGYNHAAIVLSANPSGGDTITLTVAGTAQTITFNAGAHGGSPNPVTIGATVGDTITNLKNTLKTLIGRASLVNWTSHASAGYYVGVRNCTAISDSGANVFTYRLAVEGWIDKLAAIVPAAPSSGAVCVGSAFSQTGIGAF